MKRLSILITVLMLFLQHGHAQQQRQTWSENFDGTVSFTQSPPNSWKVSTNYFVSSPNSYLGELPHLFRDSVMLITPVYDLSVNGYDFAFLRFNQICKISPRDSAFIEYRTNESGIIGLAPWKKIPSFCYLGSVINYGIRGFNASSYREWMENDSTAIPTQSWWKEEKFEISDLAGLNEVQFRFIIRRGQTYGSNISYGWLIDNFEFTGATSAIIPPVVELMPPFVKDTVYETGPYEIHAKVKSATTAPIEIPYLKWTTDEKTFDSIPMTSVEGDSLWKATIPRFVPGTKVTYYVIGKDTTKNSTVVISEYIIQMYNKGYVVLQDGSTLSGGYPFAHGSGFSRSMTIYTPNDFDSTTITNGYISSLSLRVANAGGGAFPMRVWLKTVPITKTTWVAGTDNIDWMVATQDAILVYAGDFCFAPTGWVDIPFEKYFYYSGTENLVVMFEQNCGGNNCIGFMGAGNAQSTYYYRAIGSNRCWLKTSNGAQPTTATALTLNGNRPDLRINITHSPDSNAVDIKHILSPVQSTVVSGQTTPVKITISNRGIKNLESCLIHWSVNGDTKTPFPWTGNLLWDFDDSPVIGSYIPRPSQYDTLVIWVSQPNGEPNSIKAVDTIRSIIYGCEGPMVGDFTVGAEETFPDLNTALSMLGICGVGGNVRFLLANGIYTTALNFTNFGGVMGNNMLTITSKGNHRDSVIFRPTTAATIALTINNSRNLAFDAVTFDRSTATASCVRLESNCTNIVINNCALLGRTTTTSDASPLSKANDGGIINGFRLTNSLINGGIRGVDFQTAGTGMTPGTFSTNLVFDSNTIQNANDYSIMIYYAHVKSISHNIIISRTSRLNTGMDWYGIDAQICNAERIESNTILQRASVSGTYGINLGGINRCSTSIRTSLIANNEINNVQTGIYEITAGEGTINYLHNSIYATNGSGIYLIAHSNAMRTVKKNSIHLTNGAGYPIWTGAYNPATVNIDNNNMWSPNQLGWAGGLATTIQEWQALMPTDKSSVSIQPSYIDRTQSLQLTDYTGLNCVSDVRVPNDIQGIKRGGTTVMGCYAISAFQVPIDAMLGNSISGMRQGVSAGDKDTLTVELFNGGDSPLDTVTICWQVNGTKRTNVNWTGMLLPGEGTVVTLGEITYVLGRNAVEAVVCGLGSLTDLNPLNDTARAVGHVCPVPISGTLNIPGDFANFDAFVAALDTCTAVGTINLVFSGVHTGNLNFNAISSKLENTTLIITGATGRDTLYAPTGNTITLGANENITIKDIAIKSEAGYCIFINNTCTNLVIRNCDILANPTSTSVTTGGIYKNTTHELNNVSIVGNRLDGGNYNIYIYFGLTNLLVTTPVRVVVIDSNYCTNSYTGAIYGSLIYLNTSYNHISSRLSDGNSTWTAINYSQSSGSIIGNRILAKTDNYAITGGRGIQVRVNAMASNYIANNEIRYLGNNYPQYVIDVSFIGTQSQHTNHVVHNSIYVEGQGQTSGIYVANVLSACPVKNNNVYTAGINSYPIHLGINFSGNTQIDVNNMYAPLYVGYANGAGRLSLDAWRAVVTSDNFSTSVKPVFTDVESSLIMKDYSDIFCYQYTGITRDILNNPRKTITAMGCYSHVTYLDMAIVSILNMPEFVSPAQPIPVKVKTVVSGDVPVSDAVFGWSINGVPQTPVSLTFNPPLNTFETREVPMGTFAVQDSIEEIIVWIEQVNGQNDGDASNDTVSVVLTRLPIVEFVAPFAKDTIFDNSFTVYARIRTQTGAPYSPPQLIVTEYFRGTIIYDTIPMTQITGIWTAHITGKYYDSKVVYSLSVADSMNNVFTVTDSIFLEYEASSDPAVEFVAPFVRDTIFDHSFTVYAKVGIPTIAPYPKPQLIVTEYHRGIVICDTIPMTQVTDIWMVHITGKYYDSKVVYSLSVIDPMNNVFTVADSVILKYVAIVGDSVTIGNGTAINSNMPLNTGREYGWSRQLYLSREIGNRNEGIYISDFTWEYGSTIAFTYSNQTCWFQIVDAADSVITTCGYVNPNTAPNTTQVWQGSIRFSAFGFTPKIVLNTPFYLPAGKHLIIHWEDRHTAFIGSTYGFRTTNTSVVRAIYAFHATLPPDQMPVGTCTTSTTRCNVRFGTFLKNPSYPVCDLAVIALVRPSMAEDALCSYSTAVVEVLIENRGNVDYNFAANNVYLYSETKTPIPYMTNTVLRNGILAVGQTMKAIITSTQPMITAGVYDFKIWLDASLDLMPLDDTLEVAYVSNRIGLPIDHDFSDIELPSDFRTAAMNSSATWEVIQGSDGAVTPQFGTGMLRFVGNAAAVSHLSTRQIDIYGTSQLKLSFWYFHDTVPCKDYTDLLITFNGGESFKILQTVLKYDANYYGWKEYTHDMSPYTSETCVILVFEAMSMSKDSIAQYIDRISISANQNLALDTIMIEDYTACDLKGKEIKAVLSNTTSQRVDFSATPTNIVLEIRGAIIKDTSIALFGTMEGFVIDTVTILPSFDFGSGDYTMRAYLSAATSDINKMDDTTRRSLKINPDIEITAVQTTGGNTNTDCIAFDSKVNQVVTLSNKGNLDVWDISIELEIYGSSGIPEIVKDTLKGVLVADTSMTFSRSYTVPKENYYNIKVKADLCDANQFNYQDEITECVDLDDIAVVELLNPADGTIDAVGSIINLEVSVENLSETKTYPAVTINAQITDGMGFDTLLTEVITNLEIGQTRDYRFNSSYTVPAVSNYTIKVFVNSVDQYLFNDTLNVTRQTNLGILNLDGTNFTLGQNIPNPASDNTRIEYGVPNDGQVIFTVYTITGQILYMERKDAYSGKNEIEFNTANLANGVYYYSMEYKGERLVKRMTIRK